MGKSECYRFTITPPNKDVRWSAYSRFDKLRFEEDTREQLCCAIKKELAGDEKMRCCKRRNIWRFMVVDEIKAPVETRQV